MEEEINLLSENLGRIRDAVDGIRETLNMPNASIEELEETITIPPSGTIDINSNGLVDVASYEYANVNIGEKDVNFYDYDGTLTNSYTKQEFLALESLPDNPTHEGLTAEGWSWTLQDAQDWVKKYDTLEIGQNYHTTDGSIKIHIDLDEGRLSPYLGFGINGTAIIDWGDNSTTDTITSTSTTNPIFTKHNYAQPGKYIISISSFNDIYLFGSYNNAHLLKKVTVNINEANRIYWDSIKEINCSLNTKISSYAFYGFKNLHKISLSKNSVMNNSTYVFYGCVNLKNVCCPNITNIGSAFMSGCTNILHILLPNVTSVDMSAFSGCSVLKCISLPSLTSITTQMFMNCVTLSKCLIPNVTQIGNNAFLNCVSLQNITLNKVVAIGSNAFQGCMSLANISTSNIETINGYGFQGCSHLTNISLPKMTNISGTYAFGSCYSLLYYDFSGAKAIPTLAAANSFATLSSMPESKIIVPDSLYEDWIVAANWSDSSIVGHIIKKSDWDNGGNN